jgi:hypothetical protein
VGDGEIGFFGLDGEAIWDIERFAVVEDDDASRAYFEECAVVGSEEDCGAGFVNLLEEAEDIEGELWVEVTGGLVGEDKGGLTDDGAGDGDTLLLTAGEDPRGVIATSCEPDAFEGFADAGSNEALRKSKDLEGDGDVFRDRPGVDELEVLEDDAKISAKERDGLGGETGDVATEEKDTAVVNGIGSVEEAEHGGFAGAAGAGDEDELTAFDDEVDAAQNGQAGAVGFVDVLENEDRPMGGFAGEAVTGAEHGAKADGSTALVVGTPHVEAVPKAVRWDQVYWRTGLAALTSGVRGVGDAPLSGTAGCPEQGILCPGHGRRGKTQVVLWGWGWHLTCFWFA